MLAADHVGPCDLDPDEMGAVDHPAHYNAGKLEVIDVIEDWDLTFNAGNALKYIGRHMHKGNPIEDLEKGAWYLNREIERLKAEP